MKRLTVLLLVSLALVGITLGLWAFWLEPRTLVVRKESVQLDVWTLDVPLRIGIIADLHIGSPFNQVEKLDKVIATTNQLTPDVIVLLGDYVIQGVKGGRFVPPELIAQKLAALKAPLGVYAVLGNHDWWLDAPRVGTALRSRGIHVIDDSATQLTLRNRKFWLAGVSDFLEGKHDIAAALGAVRGSEPIIVITHNPDIFPEIPQRVSLTIAGHTHGGQVALPFLGRPIVPSRYGEKYAYGYIRENGKHLFVSSGVGTSILPVRFRVPPEVVLLTITAGGEPSG